jgi:hypothetical protein
MKQAPRVPHLKICPCGQYASGFYFRNRNTGKTTACCSMACLKAVSQNRKESELKSVLSQAEEHAIKSSIPDVKGAIANLLDTPQDEINDVEVRTVIELVLDVVRRKRAHIADVINKRGPRRHG